ncbi:MAG: hypothetical protein K0R55_2380 [Sporomusa sp.]|jgi:hypothetical protein|nr:hypothetical protein [Sporomusa sp.]
MSCYRNNFFDDTTFSFPRTGFWIVHFFGSLFLILLGMRLAVRRAPLPIMAYRLFKLLRQ